MSMNTVAISGRVTRDCEIRTTASGSSILGFSLAVNDRVNEGGEWKDRPNFIDCKMFGKRADYFADKLVKGTLACVQGKLRQSSWTAKDGSKRSAVEVTVDEIELLSARSEPVEAYADEDLPF